MSINLLSPTTTYTTTVGVRVRIGVGPFYNARSGNLYLQKILLIIALSPLPGLSSSDDDDDDDRRFEASRSATRSQRTTNHYTNNGEGKRS